MVRLRIAKDRNGGVGSRGQTVAAISFTPDGTGITHYDFEPDVEQKPFKPTALMAKICAHLAAFPNASKNDLRKLGKHEWVDQAIDELVRNGHLSVSKVGQRTVFTVLEPYQEAA